MSLLDWFRLEQAKPYPKALGDGVWDNQNSYVNLKGNLFSSCLKRWKEIMRILDKNLLSENLRKPQVETNQKNNLSSALRDWIEYEDTNIIAHDSAI